MHLHPECHQALAFFPAVGLYLLGFVGLFLVPGRLAVGVLGLRRLRFLLSVALSYGFLVITLLALQAVNAPVAWFGRALLIEMGLLGLGWAIRATVVRKRQGNRPGQARLMTGTWLQRHARMAWIRKTPALVWLGLMLGLAGYMAYAGPYLELPSDALAHMRRFRIQEAMLAGDAAAAQGLVNAGNNVPVPIRAGRWALEQPLRRHLLNQGHHWYFLHAWLCRTIGLPVSRSLLAGSAGALALLLTGMYTFALSMFASFRASRRRKALAAAAAVIFLAMHLGTLAFAYIRYYAIAPTMVNYVLFLAGATLAYEWITKPGWRLAPLVMLGMITFTANAVHTQEAIYLFFTCLALATVAVWRTWRRTLNQGAEIASLRRRRWKALAALIALAGVYASLFFWIRRLPQQPLDPRFVIPLQALLPFVRNLLIQPPWGQFYETVTVWGMAVYAIWLFNAATLKKNMLITAGMLLPLFTVFNPVTVDMATRINPVAMGQLWRMNYALPLYAVAGWLLAEALGEMWRIKSNTCRLRHAAVLVMLICLLLPWHTRYLDQPYSRLATLARVPLERDIRLYSDLIEQAVSWDRAKTKVITDPLTAYVINCFTVLDCLNCQFTESHFKDWLSKPRPAEEYQAMLNTLDPAYKWILVINERDGADSPTGRISRHWPGDVLQVSRSYPPELKAFVNAHPEQFRLAWNRNRIAIYEIMPAAALAIPQ